MALAPEFFSSGISLGAGTVPGTADTSLTAPTHTTTIVSAASSPSPGTKIEQIRIIQIATTSAAGIVNVFLHDGTNYHLFDQYAFSAVTLSATNAPAPSDLYYQNLMLKNGWSLQVSVTASAGAGAFKVIAIGGDA